MMRGTTNPLNIDPEGSPARPSSGGFFAGQQDDPWYSSSGQESPASDSNRAAAFDYSSTFNMMGTGNQVNSTLGSEVDYENEPPLLEELGIHFDHIWAKTQAVLIPTKVCFRKYTLLSTLPSHHTFFFVQQINAHILDDADLAGPLCFCLLLGSCLLLSGKVCIFMLCLTSTVLL